MGVMEHSNQVASSMDSDDWRQGECLLPSLLGRFYDLQQYCDVSFQLEDGSTVQAHKLMLAVTSPTFEAMFFGPLADKGLREVRVEDVKPSGFRRLVHFIYNSKCLSWKIDEAEEWWYILEAANKYLNTRLVGEVERRLREVAKRDAGKNVILRHLNMANRMSGIAGGIKSVFMNTVIKSTSKLLTCEEWTGLDLATVQQIYSQDFLAATEGELYLGAKNWCLANTSSEPEALKLFLDKFVQKITPEFMSQRDFLSYVASDSFLGQVDVFRDWTIKVMVRNAADHTIRGSYRPMRTLEFYFNAQQKGNSPVQFKEEVHTIDFQSEVTRYTASITSVWDGSNTGLHLNLNTESTAKPTSSNRPLALVKPGPKSTKSGMPSLPEMISDEEGQKTSRKSALIVVKFRDGTYRAEVLVNMDDNGSGYTSKQMFAGTKAEIEYVQVRVVIDARSCLKVGAISHKQFVEHVGSQHVADRTALEALPQARQFQFIAENTSMEQAEREICRSLRLKDCQAWYVDEDKLCRKREVVNTDSTDLAGFMRYDSIQRMIEEYIESTTLSRGRAVYLGKGGDETDLLLGQLTTMAKKYRAPKFWIMLEKEFKDDKDKLVSSVCKFDSTSGSLSYCGTICLQMNEEALLKPTEEFFNMILYNSDPQSKVFLRRFLNPIQVTSVIPSEDIAGIHNFDIFVIQEGAKTPDAVTTDYDKFIVQKINEISVTFRAKSGSIDRVLQLNLDSTQGINHVKDKLYSSLEVARTSPISVFECISSEGATANPLKRRSFRRPMEQPLVDEDPRKVADLFAHCEDGTKTLYYHI